MRWVGHISRIERRGKHAAFRYEIEKKSFLYEYDELVWIGFMRLKVRSNGGSCEYDSERLLFIKCSDILEQLSDWQFLKKGSTSWR
jgi:hypothetical protein